MRQILFISQHAIRQRGFVGAFFVQATKLQPKTLVLHETGVEDPELNWFVSKRISGGLSEQMVPNNALLTERSQHLTLQPDGLQLNAARVAREMENVHALIMNPVAWHAAENESVVVDSPQWLQTVRSTFPDVELLLFPDNPESAIGLDKPIVSSAEDADKLIESFPEETRIILMALAAAPARIVLATNFAA